jgi:hypothetical protein
MRLLKGSFPIGKKEDQMVRLILVSHAILPSLTWTPFQVNWKGPTMTGRPLASRLVQLDSERDTDSSNRDESASDNSDGHGEFAQDEREDMLAKVSASKSTTPRVFAGKGLGHQPTRPTRRTGQVRYFNQLPL